VVSNGVLYVASMAATGSEMYALDPATGSILRQFAAGGSVGAHPAIADGTVNWSSGFITLFPGSIRNDKVYGFSVDGK
jgi:polyvinyl alcohol dehydrogenase (cytochrome)